MMRTHCVNYELIEEDIPGGDNWHEIPMPPGHFEFVDIAPGSIAINPYGLDFRIRGTKTDQASLANNFFNVHLATNAIAVEGQNVRFYFGVKMKGDEIFEYRISDATNSSIWLSFHYRDVLIAGGRKAVGGVTE